MTRTSRIQLVLAALLVTPLLVVAQPAFAAKGDLTQVGRPPAGCITESGNAEACTGGARGMESALRNAISKDGKSVYVASQVDDAIAVFSRNATTGALTQLAGTQGCISESGTDGCADGIGLDGPNAVAVSADGKFVYAASGNSAAVTTFARNTTTGALTQLPGEAGCISDSGAGDCADGNALANTVGVAVTADGKSVYVGGNVSDGVAAFARNTTTGKLTQLAGSAGCVTDSGADGCTDGRGLNGVLAVTASADGTSVYVASQDSHSVAVFARNTTTGALTQLSGTAGCVADDGADGCFDGRKLNFARDVVVSPDGTSVYIASSDGLTAFSRQTTTAGNNRGKLTQLSGAAGCVTESGADDCTDGVSFDALSTIAVSADNKTVHVSSGNGVVSFTRQLTTTGGNLGKLTQLQGSAACITETGAGGCTDGISLNAAFGVVISGDGKFVYVTSPFPGGMAVLARQTTTTGGTFGKLTQAGRPPSACVSEDGTGEVCTDGSSMSGVTSTAASPDGKSVYVTSDDSDAVTIFQRNLTTGALTQLAGNDGCISETGVGDCVDGAGLNGARAVAVSSDNKTVYVVSNVSNAIAVFARNLTTGALTQLGTGACISETGAGVCADGTALDGPRSVAVSADGKSVYVASQASDAVAVFSRQTATTNGTQGRLTQLTGADACVAETDAGGCTDGVALDAPGSVAVSADSKSVYVASEGSDAVSTFARQTTGTPVGKLTQLTGTAACVSETGSDGCDDGDGLDAARSVAISPDGASVYVASVDSNAVAVFSRQTAAGATQGKLNQLDGTAACISETGAAECANGRALEGPTSVTVSNDGASVYVASSFSNALVVLSRQTTNTAGNLGKLTQASGSTGCLSESGADGCFDAVALDGASAVTSAKRPFTTAGQSVYVASPQSNAVAVFSRQP